MWQVIYSGYFFKLIYVGVLFVIPRLGRGCFLKNMKGVKKHSISHHNPKKSFGSATVNLQRHGKST
jgi:hypothetical protein